MVTLNSEVIQITPKDQFVYKMRFHFFFYNPIKSYSIRGFTERSIVPQSLVKCNTTVNANKKQCVDFSTRAVYALPFVTSDLTETYKGYFISRLQSSFDCLKDPIKPTFHS